MKNTIVLGLVTILTLNQSAQGLGDFQYERISDRNFEAALYQNAIPAEKIKMQLELSKIPHQHYQKGSELFKKYDHQKNILHVDEIKKTHQIRAILNAYNRRNGFTDTSDYTKAADTALKHRAKMTDPKIMTDEIKNSWMFKLITSSNLPKETPPQILAAHKILSTAGKIGGHILDSISTQGEITDAYLVAMKTESYDKEIANEKMSSKYLTAAFGIAQTDPKFKRALKEAGFDLDEIEKYSTTGEETKDFVNYSTKQNQLQANINDVVKYMNSEDFKNELHNSLERMKAEQGEEFDRLLTESHSQIQNDLQEIFNKIGEEKKLAEQAQILENYNSTSSSIKYKLTQNSIALAAYIIGQKNPEVADAIQVAAEIGFGAYNEYLAYQNDMQAIHQALELNPSLGNDASQMQSLALAGTGIGVAMVAISVFQGIQNSKAEATFKKQLMEALQKLMEQIAHLRLEMQKEFYTTRELIVDQVFTIHVKLNEIQNMQKLNLHGIEQLLIKVDQVSLQIKDIETLLIQTTYSYRPIPQCSVFQGELSELKDSRSLASRELIHKLGNCWSETLAKQNQASRQFKSFEHYSEQYRNQNSIANEKINDLLDWMSTYNFNPLNRNETLPNFNDQHKQIYDLIYQLEEYAGAGIFKHFNQGYMEDIQNLIWNLNQQKQKTALFRLDHSEFEQTIMRMLEDYQKNMNTYLDSIKQADQSFEKVVAKNYRYNHFQKYMPLTEEFKNNLQKAEQQFRKYTKSIPSCSGGNFPINLEKQMAKIQLSETSVATILHQNSSSTDFKLCYNAKLAPTYKGSDNFKFPMSKSYVVSFNDLIKFDFEIFIIDSSKQFEKPLAISKSKHNIQNPWSYVLSKTQTTACLKATKNIKKASESVIKSCGNKPNIKINLSYSDPQAWVEKYYQQIKIGFGEVILPKNHEIEENEHNNNLANLLSNQLYAFNYLINAQNDSSIISKVSGIYGTSTHFQQSMSIVGSQVNLKALQKAQLIRLAIVEALKFGYDSELERKPVWSKLTGKNILEFNFDSLLDISELFKEKDPQSFIEKRKNQINDLVNETKQTLLKHQPEKQYFHPTDLLINRLENIRKLENYR